MYAAAGLTEGLEAKVIFSEKLGQTIDTFDCEFCDEGDYPTAGVFAQDNQGVFTVVTGDGPDLFLLADRVANVAHDYQHRH